MGPSEGRRPGARRSRAALAAGWIALAALVLLLKLTEAALPIGGDQGIYSYIGQAILDGQVPYRDLTEQKPPLVFYLRAGIQALVSPDWVSPCLPGPLRASCPWLTLQAADYLYTLAFATALYLLGRAAGFSSAAAILSALLGAASISLVRVSQQGLTPEKLVVLPTTLALLCALRGRAGAAGWWLGAGTLIAAGVLAKQPAATVLLPVALLALGERTGRARRAAARLGLLALGASAPLLVAGAGLQAQGALAPMLEYTVALNLGRFGVSAEANGFGGETALLDAWHVFRDGLAPFWLLGWVGTLAALRGPRSLSPLMVTALWAVVDTALLARLREYLQLSPSYALLGGWALHRLWLAAGHPPHFGLNAALAARTLLATWLGAVVVLSSGFQGSVMMRAINERGVRDFIRSPDEWVADELRRLRPGPLYVWGNAAHLYLYAGRRPASSYLNNTFLSPSWPGGERARATLLAKLEQLQPSVIVINPTIYWPDLALERFPALVELLEAKYAPVPGDSRFAGWRLYERRAQGP